METFFTSYRDIPPERAFQPFDLSHILAILSVAVTVATLLHVPTKMRNTTLKICAVLVPLAELTHVIWLLCCGQTQLTKLLPLHICGTQVFFIPAAVFTEKTVLKDYVYATSLLGGALAILSPSGVAGTYPIFHYQTIQTLFLHMLLIFVPLAMVFWTGYTPSVKRLPGVLAVFAVVAAIAFTVDSAAGENYMFLVFPPEVSFLTNIFTRFGQGIYLLLSFLLLLAASVVIQLPFDLYKKRTGKG